MHAEDFKLPPAIVMRDNDGKYTREVDKVFESSAAAIKRNTPVSPNLRAHVERVIQILKTECLSRFVIVSERHLNLINTRLREWYNVKRPHSA